MEGATEECDPFAHTAQAVSVGWEREVGDPVVGHPDDERIEGELEADGALAVRACRTTFVSASCTIL